jgi:hypothetical protein
MTTQSAHLIALPTRSVDRDAATGTDGDGIGGRIVTRMRQLYCGLLGHDALMQFEKGRVFLQCASCGHETPGWTLPDAAPRIRFRGDARRHALVRPHLVSARHTA